MMRALALLAVLALASCNVDRPSLGSPVVVWTDQQTGCQYLVATGAGVTDWSNRGGSITPRLGPGGKPICGLKTPT